MLSHRRGRALAAGALALLCSSALVSACGGNNEKTASVSTNAGPTQDTSGRSDRSTAGDRGKFGAPATGANKWMPLKPGTQSVRLGHVNRGNRRLTHRRVLTVTDVSKKIGGVRTVAVLDQDIDAGQVAEQALDYLAEDKQGNVWYLGSYTEAYEGGQFVNVNDAWLDGVKGGGRGILVPAKPRTGTPQYVQASIPGQGPDVAQVAKTGQKNCVPFKCYRNVLVIHEGTGDGEYKYFAPGVGEIRIEPRYKGGEQEVEELINVTQLSPRALSELSAEALKLDKHARSTAKDVFGSSSPAKRTL
jgi:hypothetical protein